METSLPSQAKISNASTSEALRPYVPFTVELILGVSAADLRDCEFALIGATNIRRRESDGQVVADWPQFFWEWEAETPFTPEDSNGMVRCSMHQARARGDGRLSAFWASWESRA